jgi:phage gpG-like protein
MQARSPNISLVVKELDTLDARVMAAAELGLRRGMLGTVGIIQRQFLSGPRPLKLDVRTTRLRNSITHRVENRAGRIMGTAGTNVVYAPRHEFGSRGLEQVSAHTRVIRQWQRDVGSGTGFVSVDNRRVLRDRRKNFIGFKESRKQAMGRIRSGLAQVQYVKAHQRRVNYKGRPFARPGVAKATPLVLREIVKEINSLKGK